ncbi:MAG TPA: HEAT repeat domain-containing protein [Planctomycetaceae bacterium]|nr:HEAT repeat domain-containing protein [Planctomycetaceae bacterium]
MNAPRRRTGFPLPGLASVLVAAVGLAVGWMVWQSSEARREQADLVRRREALLDPEATLRDRMRAVDLWVQQGPAAVPQLLASLESPGPQVRAAAVTALARIRPLVEEAVTGVTRMLDDPEAEVRRAAVAGLRGLFEQRLLESEPHVPRLIRLLDDPDQAVRTDLLGMTWRLRPGPLACAELTRLTASRRAETRRTAAQLICSLERADEQTIAAVRRLLHDPEPAVRNESFRALVAHGSFSRDEAIAALDSNDNAIRSLGCLAVAVFGESARVATSRLRELLQSRQDMERALGALAAIGRPAEAAVPDVLQVLGDVDDEADAHAEYWRGHINGCAFRCLARISSDEAQVVSTLAEGLFSSNPLESRFAAETLREFFPEQAGASVPALIAALACREEARMPALLAALGGIGADASAVPPLVELLPVSDARVFEPPISNYAIETLGRMGTAAEDAVPALAIAVQAQMDRREDRYRDVSLMMIFKALYHVGVRSPAAEGAVIRFIDQERPLLGRNLTQAGSNLANHLGYAALALGRVGAGSEGAYESVCDILEALEDPEVFQRAGWIDPRLYWALADLGVRPEETAALLLRAAREEADKAAAEARDASGLGPTQPPAIRDNHRRLAVIRGLGLYPESAVRSVPVLIEMLHDGDRQVQLAAALALGQLGERAHEAVPELRRLAATPGDLVPAWLQQAARNPGTLPSAFRSESLPVPVEEFAAGLSKLSVRDVARQALDRIRASDSPVAAPRPGDRGPAF